MSTTTNARATQLTLVAKLAEAARPGSFAAKIAVSFTDALRRYTVLTEKQLNLLGELLASAAEPIAAPATVPAPEGRIRVTGKIVTTKRSEYVGRSFGYYANTATITTKALVIVSTEAGEWKLWVTVPAKAFEQGIELRGSTITVDVTVTLSKNDASFAIGKRPTFISLV